MKWMRTGTLAAALGALLALGGCADDDQQLRQPLLTGPDVGEGADALFQRYVALGNSITAGYQSGGIVDSTQRTSYPNLVAQQVGAQFTLPLLAAPGCPPPLVSPFSSERTAPVPCALRSFPAARGPIQNVAVPGARLVDAFDNLIPESSANALTTFILGGRTQVEAMLDANPTLVTAWLGNNDALGGALLGDPALLTPLAEFQGSLATLVDAIAQTRAAENDAVALFGAVNPLIGAPALQPGAYVFAAAQASPDGTFLGKPVDASCSPLVPANAAGTQFRFNPLSRNLISALALNDPRVQRLTCAPSEAAGARDYLITTAEQVLVAERVAGFNQAIAAAAESQGWIYIDPNVALAAALAEQRDGVFFNRIRKCQALRPVLDALQAAGTIPAQQIPAVQQQLRQAIGISCPVIGPTAAPNFFGSLISFDGVHPSDEGQTLLANVLIGALNQRFGLSIPLLAVPPIR